MSENRLFLSGEENEKVIRNPRTDPDHYQKSITSRWSSHCPCMSSLVDVRFHVRQLSCLQNDTTNKLMTENDHITSALIGGGNICYRPSERVKIDRQNIFN